MSLLLQEREGGSFTMQDVKFVADVVKLLQDMLCERQEGCAAGTGALLADILDNVCCGIYVEDKKQAKCFLPTKS